MRDLIADTLGGLGRRPGVRSALVVELEAGIPITIARGEEVGRGDLNTDAISALATFLYRRLSRASGSAEYGEVSTVVIEGGAGHLLLVPSGSLLVVVVADQGTELDPLRIEARRVAEVLR